MQKTITPQDIRDRAFAARVTINKLLKTAGVANSTFWRWEKGDTEMVPLTLARIEDALATFETDSAA